MTTPISEGSRIRRRSARSTGERDMVLVLRGVIGDRAEDDLRRALQVAIDDGAVVVLDLSEVETLTSSARELLASAGSALADRGGVLLGWTTHGDVGHQSHVMRELRDPGALGHVAPGRTLEAAP